jgi:hypothetical protein
MALWLLGIGFVKSIVGRWSASGDRAVAFGRSARPGRVPPVQGYNCALQTD